MLGQPFDQPDANSINTLGDSTDDLSLAAGGSLPIELEVALPASQPNPEKNSFRAWQWLMIVGSLCCTTGGVAAAAWWWLVALPPSTDCQQMTTLSTDRERLYCAQDAANAGDVEAMVSGLELLEQWTPEHPLYQEAQNSLSDWSEAVLVAARGKVNQDDLEGAIALVSHIPESSPVYAEAQTAIANWQGEWQRGRAIYQEAQTAIQQQKWAEATAKIRELSGLRYDYWRSQRTLALSRQIAIEQQAQKYLTQARNEARGGRLANLSAAIKTASQIDQESYAWKTVQTDLNHWSEVLLQVGLQLWQQGKVDQSLGIGQRVALNPEKATAAQDLIWLSQARKQAIASQTDWAPNSDHLWRLIKAIAIASRIESESRFYEQAQASLNSWQMQLKDVSELQIAQTLASINQPFALNLAIAQAQEVASDRPRRVQAQTLVAHWQQELGRVEDRPVLVAAKQLATPGTIAALRAAIEQAQQIAPGRALRKEAQTWIATWQRRIERQEDQPILARAESLAAAGNLNEAIQEVAAIGTGRALYDEAQAAAANWRAEIRAIEVARSRPIYQAPAAVTPVFDSPSVSPRYEPARRRGQESFRPAAPAPQPAPQPVINESRPVQERSAPGNFSPIDEVPQFPPAVAPLQDPNILITEPIPVAEPAPPPPLPTPAPAPPMVEVTPAPVTTPSQSSEALIAPPAPAPPQVAEQPEWARQFDEEKVSVISYGALYNF